MLKMGEPVQLSNDKLVNLYCDICATTNTVMLSDLVILKTGDYIHVTPLICEVCFNAVRQEIVK